MEIQQMKKLIRIVIILCLTQGMIFVFSSAEENWPEPRFQYLQVKDGLTQNSIRCIFQDSRGFIWIGTGAGLNKYDGYKFTHYLHSDKDSRSVSNDYISVIDEDAVGYLWLGTMGGGLNRLDPASETFTHYPFQKNQGTSTNEYVRAIHVDKNGILWLSMVAKGLLRFNPQTGTYTHHYKPEQYFPAGAGHTFSIHEDPQGRLLLGTLERFLRFDPKTEEFEVILSEENEPGGHNHINAVIDGDDGRLWLGTAQKGLIKWDYKNNRFTSYPLANPHNIQTFYRDPSGIIWIGTAQNGLYFFDPENGQFKHHVYNPSVPEGLNDNGINAIMPDRSGMVWVASNGKGINLYDRNRRKFSLFRAHISDPKSQRDNIIICLHQSRPEVLWLGNVAGVLIKFDKSTGTFSRYKVDPDAYSRGQNIHILSISEDSAGELWIGTGGRGLFRFNPGTGIFTSVPLTAEGSSRPGIKPIPALMVDSSGVLWIGMAMGGLATYQATYQATYHLDTQTIKHYTYDPGDPGSISHNTVSCLMEDEKSDVWVGTWGGLNRFDRQSGRFIRYLPEPGRTNGLSDYNILSMMIDRHGIFWIGTLGGGLNRFDRGTGTFSCFTTRDGLPDNTIYYILSDEKDRLWLSTNRGLSRFDPKTGIFRNYSPWDGLQGFEFNSGTGLKSPGGELFFGGTNGLNVFHPAKLKGNTYVPPVRFTGFKVLNQPVSIGFTREVTLPYNRNIFSLEFAALDYSNPSANQYKYKMDGLHEEWISLGHDHQINFTGLEPGRYWLRVIGSNNDGLWNRQGAVLNITITPPFWATWWFRGLVLSLILSLLALAHRLRMKHATLKLKTQVDMHRLFDKHGLTPREKEVLELVMKGKSNNQIEEELYISLDTVKKHLYRSYKKLGVKNRLELINSIQRTLPGNKTSGLSSH